MRHEYSANVPDPLDDSLYCRRASFAVVNLQETIKLRTSGPHDQRKPNLIADDSELMRTKIRQALETA